jgi:hypothetical protein
LQVEKGKGRYRNRYAFCLETRDRLLQHAMTECVARINRNAIGAALGRPRILEFNDECDVIYINIRDAFMTSRRLAIAREIRQLTREGKLVFIGCASQDDINLFEEELAEADHSLVKFVLISRI